MAQCGGIGVNELNKLELELCWRLDWSLMPCAAQLHKLREALDDENSPYWKPWSNPAKLACDDDSIEQPHKSPSTKTRMPHAKSFQDQMGRIFFGSAHADGSLPKGVATQRESNGHAYAEAKMAPPSPGSPRSVFRRIFSEHVFNFNNS